MSVEADENVGNIVFEMSVHCKAKLPRHNMLYDKQNRNNKKRKEKKKKKKRKKKEEKKKSNE